MRPLSSIGLKVFFTTVPSSFLATQGDGDDDGDDGVYGDGDDDGDDGDDGNDGDDGDDGDDDGVMAMMAMVTMCKPVMTMSLRQGWCRSKIVMLATIAIRMYCTCSWYNTIVLTILIETRSVMLKASQPA